ncbi:hypothetical protein [Arthrobacter sp. StoSoilB5]|uniref:hypothetical protein n=1 Tax=Arthrobacter sp. StoSoilB5 TaxID=2830992 RepID=UPI001CC472E8|nr:hypothetical protein [Arthrobacter sp. StoSoilB5]BCW44612.1 hypothetical protein StoSoilB5_17960 [Arthrobacter sp. StoSoilB5]
MKIQKMSKRGYVVAVSLCAVLGLGAGASVATAAGGLAPSNLASETKAAPEYPRNANGNTYGFAIDSVSPETEPDLIAGLTTDGKRGYVSKAELDVANGTAASREFKTPEDAVKWTETEGRADRSIPVYEADGKTVIGEFTVSGSDTQKANQALTESR